MSRGTPNRARHWLRSPALHFLLIGIVLYLGKAQISDGNISRVLTVDATRIEQLRNQWQAASGHLPNAQEEEWLIQRWIEDEMLYREALELALDRDDPGVCYRLVLNMRFLGMDQSLASRSTQEDDNGPEWNWRDLCRQARQLGLHRDDPVVRRQMVTMMRLALQKSPILLRGTQEAVSHAELLDYVARHRERFSEPARLRLNHVFLSRNRRGDSLEENARQLLKQLDSWPAPPLGDPFLPGPHPVASSQRDLERLFGSAFARAVMSLPEERWSGPIESGYGMHLVWIHERLPARLRPLEEIEEQAILGLRAERAEHRLANALEQLRAQWEVRIERNTGSDSPGED